MKPFAFTRRGGFKLLLLASAISWQGPAQAGAYEDFFQGIKQDNGRLITHLLQRGMDPNTMDPSGVPALVVALKDTSYEVATVLIHWPGTRVEARNPADESPLMLASLNGELALCELLISKGAHVNKTGWTALHYAATHGHIGVMNLLLNAHAYIDAESPNGTTPLMMAAKYGTGQAVKLLLDAGADSTVKNSIGLTALDFAQRADRVDAIAILEPVARALQPKGSW